MGVRSWVWRLGLVVVVLSVITVVLGELTGHPLFLGYVQTPSMDPVIAPGDGFVALSPLVTPPPGQGDLIVFESQTQEVDLTVHRIVGETEEGFITRGDNSTFTDQDAGEPPVSTQRIVGQPLVLGDNPVTIPGYGPFVVGVQNGLQSLIEQVGLGRYPGARIAVALLLVGLAMVAGGTAYDLLASEGRSVARSTGRSAIDSRLLLLALLILIAVPVVTFMTLPSETNQVTIMSSETASGPGVFPPGTQQTVEFEVTNTQYVPKVIVVGAPGDGASVSEPVLTVGHGERATTNYTVSVPPDAGRYIRFRSQHHYPHLLPLGVILWLHGVSPTLATLVLMGVVLLPVAVLFWLLVGFRPIHLRSASRGPRRPL